MRNIFIVLVLLNCHGAFAQEVVNMGEYDISTTKEISITLQNDSCAWAAADAVKKSKIDKKAMEEGTDLPDLVDVTFLAPISRIPRPGKRTYSITMNEEAWLVVTLPSAASCTVTMITKGALGGASVGSSQ